MAYVPVPKDFSKIKTKLALNLTKRQIICFSLSCLRCSLAISFSIFSMECEKGNGIAA